MNLCIKAEHIKSNIAELVIMSQLQRYIFNVASMNLRAYLEHERIKRYIAELPKTSQI